MSEQISLPSKVCIHFRIHPWTDSPRCSASEYRKGKTDKELVKKKKGRTGKENESEIDRFISKLALRLPRPAKQGSQ